MVTLGEQLTARSMEGWTLSGPNALVKVVSVEMAREVQKRGVVAGYVTQAKFLTGLNANQIERDLGLRPGSMRRGLLVFWLARLPKMNEIEQRYFANWPGGYPWTEWQYKEYMEKREGMLTNTNQILDYYVPGSDQLRQWRLSSPVEISGLCRQSTPSTPFSL